MVPIVLIHDQILRARPLPGPVLADRGDGRNKSISESGHGDIPTEASPPNQEGAE